MEIKRKSGIDIHSLWKKSKIKGEKNFISILFHRNTHTGVLVLLGTVDKVLLNKDYKQNCWNPDKKRLPNGLALSDRRYEEETELNKIGKQS